MKQEQIAGFLLCAIGLLLAVKPVLVWKMAESWKGEGSTAPSGTYLTLLRIISGTATGVGLLLAVGILK